MTFQVQRERTDVHSVPAAPQKRASECAHVDRAAWARGRCKSCYDRWLRENRPEYAEAQRRSTDEWKTRYPERVRAISRAGNARVTSEDRRRTVLAKYGMTVADYATVLASQGGACAICQRQPKSGRALHVDHCHRTGLVRGLLCFRCNYGLSFFGDDAATIARAGTYLAGSS